MKNPLIIRVSGKRDLAQHLQTIGHLLEHLSLFIIPADSKVSLGQLPDGVKLLTSDGIGKECEVILDGKQSIFKRNGGTCNIAYLYDRTLLGRILDDIEKRKICGVYFDRVDLGTVSMVASSVVALSMNKG
ncbi:MAG: hypothetical protein WCO18_00855 [bacterium]